MGARELLNERMAVLHLKSQEWVKRFQNVFQDPWEGCLGQVLALLCEPESGGHFLLEIGLFDVALLAHPCPNAVAHVAVLLWMRRENLTFKAACTGYTSRLRKLVPNTAGFSVQHVKTRLSEELKNAETGIAFEAAWNSASTDTQLWAERSHWYAHLPLPLYPTLCVYHTRHFQ